MFLNVLAARNLKFIQKTLMINHLAIILGEGTQMKENYDPTNHSNGQTLDKTRSQLCTVVSVLDDLGVI